MRQVLKLRVSEAYDGSYHWGLFTLSGRELKCVRCPVRTLTLDDFMTLVTDGDPSQAVPEDAEDVEKADEFHRRRRIPPSAREMGRNMFGDCERSSTMSFNSDWVGYTEHVGDTEKADSRVPLRLQSWKSGAAKQLPRLCSIIVSSLRILRG